MLIQSFARDDKSFADFSGFLGAMGEKDEARPGILFGPFGCDGVAFYMGWVDDHETVDRDQIRCTQQLQNYASRLSKYCDRLRAWCDGN
jgi:hypothetical protein